MCYMTASLMLGKNLFSQEFSSTDYYKLYEEGDNASVAASSYTIHSQIPGEVVAGKRIVSINRLSSRCVLWRLTGRENLLKVIFTERRCGKTRICICETVFSSRLLWVTNMDQWTDWPLTQCTWPSATPPKTPSCKLRGGPNPLDSYRPPLCLRTRSLTTIGIIIYMSVDSAKRAGVTQAPDTAVLARNTVSGQTSPLLGTRAGQASPTGPAPR